VNANGTGSGRLYTDSEDGSAYDPSWSPDGNVIAFSMRMVGGNEEIFLVNTNGSGLTRLTFDANNDRWPDWAPDGSRIVFQAHRDGNWGVWAMNADGSGQTNLTPDTPQIADEHPAWSPDGTKIVFYRGGQLWVMRADGGDNSQITSNPYNTDHPDWAPGPTPTPTPTITPTPVPGLTHWGLTATAILLGTLILRKIKGASQRNQRRV